MSKSKGNPDSPTRGKELVHMSCAPSFLSGLPRGLASVLPVLELWEIWHNLANGRIETGIGAWADRRYNSFPLAWRRVSSHSCLQHHNFSWGCSKYWLLTCLHQSADETWYNLAAWKIEQRIRLELTVTILPILVPHRAGRQTP